MATDLGGAKEVRLTFTEDEIREDEDSFDYVLRLIKTQGELIRKTRKAFAAAVGRKE